ncbi:MAG: 50S ribosomal protein L3 [Myxococcota bacterium]|nr:50S ribosomal protein L3 [Myxococcota bacterium]
MEKAIYGKKLGMSHLYDKEGNRVAVTVIEAQPNVIIGKKSQAADKYDAVRVAFGEVNPRRLNKPTLGVFKKTGQEPRRFTRELRLNAGVLEGLKVGDSIKVDIFSEGEKVDVTGVSIGKGFQGVVKRWGFGGGRATHGGHEYFRHPGSIGMREWPGRVFKGHKMGGHMGHRQITTQSQKLVKIDPEKNLLFIAGSVPGPKEGFIMVKNTVKVKRKKA